MKTSNELSKEISVFSYKTLKNSNVRMKGKNYRVIVKRDDTQNDLRSYAYAPIVNGNSDTNNIVMSYAGTELTI
ncbi:hypothetical protein [Staphylococcus gallinarum]|uniref:hypothetical protein n=1 Tax=Staphylococcus gallinarum TaxID=1293 RepID=UPI001E5FDCAF|nr:hypothetical protein [Staphylococcus gallinarum]